MNGAALNHPSYDCGNCKLTFTVSNQYGNEDLDILNPKRISLLKFPVVPHVTIPRNFCTKCISKDKQDF